MGSSDDASCASKIIGAAGKLCSGILKAESKHIKSLAKDPTGDGLDAGIQKAVDKFNSVYASASATCAGWIRSLPARPALSATKGPRSSAPA